MLHTWIRILYMSNVYFISFNALQLKSFHLGLSCFTPTWNESFLFLLHLCLDMAQAYFVVKLHRLEQPIGCVI